MCRFVPHLYIHFTFRKPEMQTIRPFTNQICSVDRLLSINEETLEDVMRIQRERASDQIMRRAQFPSTSEIHATIRAIKEHTGIELQYHHMDAVFGLYPLAAIEVSMHGIDDTESLVETLHALAHLLCGTEFKDDERLKVIMRKQALELFPPPPKFVQRNPNKEGA